MNNRFTIFVTCGDEIQKKEAFHMIEGSADIRGGVKLRELNAMNYQGSLSVEWED
jgi:hypothetical protein